MPLFVVSRSNNKSIQQLFNRHYAGCMRSDSVGTLQAFTLTLREATIEDVLLLKKWDEQDCIQAVSGDKDFNDWNWEYELLQKPTTKHGDANSWP
jgi:hypothetical protein